MVFAYSKIHNCEKKNERKRDTKAIKTREVHVIIVSRPVAVDN